jgi:hypothetical protein
VSGRSEENILKQEEDVLPSHQPIGDARTRERILPKEVHVELSDGDQEVYD